MWRFWKLVAIACLAGLVVAVAHLANRAVFTQGPVAPVGHLQPVGVQQPLKPGEPLHILFAGTSAVARGTWVEQDLQAALSRCRKSGVTVERVAQAGANSRWGEAALTQRLAQLPAADIVLIEFAGNDARLYRGMRLGASGERHRRMVQGSQAAKALPFLVTMGRAVGRERLERPGYRAFQQQYRAIARDMGAGLVDTAPRWDALSRAELAAYLPDGVHFTGAAASELLVPGFVEALSPLVCDPVAG